MLVLIALLLAQDGVVREMTPAAVAEAQAEGKAWAVKDKIPFDVYKVWPGGSPTAVGSCGLMSTPFFRVAFTAYQAAKAYKDPAAPTEEMLAPVLEIRGSSDVGNDVREVVAVVVAKADGTILQPLTSEAKEVTYTNGFGRKSVGTAINATFPLDVLAEGNEVRVAYSAAKECRHQIKLKKMR